MLLGCLHDEQHKVIEYLREENRELQEERRLAAALYKMNKKIDSIENVTWYRDQRSPCYSHYNGFFLYVGQRATGAPWLRLRVQYNADDWLFIESFLSLLTARGSNTPR